MNLLVDLTVHAKRLLSIGVTVAVGSSTDLGSQFIEGLAVQAGPSDRTRNAVSIRPRPALSELKLASCRSRISTPEGVDLARIETVALELLLHDLDGSVLLASPEGSGARVRLAIPLVSRIGQGRSSRS